MNYQEILQQAIDLHVHIGPEVIPRRFTLSELLEYEKGRLQGIGVKNHFFPTVAAGDFFTKNRSPFVIHSVVLNHYVGGFNPDIIRASAELTERPIIVWFPTLHSEKFLSSQKYEVPEEWVTQENRKKLKIRRTKNIKSLSVFNKEKKISEEVKEVLYAIKECGAILATGHLSWEESRELVNVAAKEVGIRKVIVTHPIYQRICMPMEIQKELAGLGALIEHCYSMYSIDKISINKIVTQMREVGANNCILSSDVGQAFSKSPSEALIEFISLLEKGGVSEEEIKIMLIKNPYSLIQ